MNEYLSYIQSELYTLKQKKQNGEVLTSDEITNIRLLEKVLIAIKECLLRGVYSEIFSQNEAAIRGYLDYLESEVGKYTNRLELQEAAKAAILENSGYDKRIDRQIERTAAKLADASNNLANYRQNFDEFVRRNEVKSANSGGSVISYILSAPVDGSDMLATTRYGSNVNDFLLQDSETGKVRLNREAVNLCLEVLEERKLDRLRSLVLANNSGEKSISTECLHAFDRICHYVGLQPFSQTRIENIDEGIFETFDSASFVPTIVSRLRLALIADDFEKFNRQDLVNMIGEEEVQNYQSSIQDEMNRLRF